MADKKYNIDDILKIFGKIEHKIEDLTCFVKDCCAKVPINIGSGFGLYKKFTQGKWQFKSLLPGSGVSLSETPDEIIISATAQPLDCDDIKDCIGISPSGDPNKYLNEQGDWQTITVPISTVGDTATVNLTVTGTTLTADFASMNISQFTNDSGYGTGTVTNVAATVPVVTNPFLSVNVPNPTTTPSVDLTANGLVSQYVRGDGSLANFPISSGGGSSVIYYLNGGTNQGVFGGNTYYEMNKTAVIGLAANFNINSPGYIAQFITDPGDPALLNIPTGNWNFETYFSASSGGGNPNFYLELYKYDGVNFTLIASNNTNPEAITGGTVTDLYVSALAVPQTTLLLTDRLAVRIFVNNSGRTITLHTQDNTLCQITTTFTTGLTALNGLTDQIQFFATGTTGTDFGITSSVATHTFNLPVASSVNTGKLSNTDWSTFNSKVSGSGTINEIAYFSGTGTLSSLTTTTYPSLTELSYVKGVTSAIQTQINAIKTDTITFSADGGGGVITTGRYGGFWRCPYNCTITGWYLQEGSNTSSSCVIDTWKKATYPPTVADSIWVTKPSLSAATNNSATGLSIAVTAGDWIGFNIDSCTSATYLTLVLIVTKP